jgi:two-component system chemotaxis sensor kinase CheA
MKTRMQPIGSVWNKFPRLVRDLALACGKQVQIEMEGEETELDKTLIEAIRDPLTMDLTRFRRKSGKNLTRRSRLA